VIGADGLRSTVATAVDAPIERRGTAATAAIYGYWPELDIDGYEWIFRPDTCAGLIPTNGNQTCVFVVASPARIGRGGMEVFHDVMRTASPALAYRLHSARLPVGPRTFGGVPGYLRVPHGPGWALVGDAGYWKDPISAHGLTDALRDAELVARAVIAIALDGVTEADAFGDYHETRNRLSLRLFDVVETIAAMRWTDAEIVDLLLELSVAMTDETETIARLDEPAVTGGRR
jgi:flavin-dependent dehydrogenase